MKGIFLTVMWWNSHSKNKVKRRASQKRVIKIKKTKEKVNKKGIKISLKK